MNVEYFISRRMKLSAHGKGSSVATRIAKASVVIGIVVMIISLAVINGFRKEITSLLSGFGSHIQIVNLDGNSSFETLPISKDQPFLDELAANKAIVSINPYAIKAGITRSQDDIQGVMLKGVDHNYDWSFFKKNLVVGSLPRMNDTLHTKDVLISRRLSQILKLSTGDNLDMLFIEQPPRRDRFRISGIYDTGFEDMDDIAVITDLRNVQRLNRWDENQVTGFEIMCNNINNIDQITLEVDDIVYNSLISSIGSEPESLNDQSSTGNLVLNTSSTKIENLRVNNIRDLNPIIFDWLQTHNLNAIVIITIMLAVSLLGMISAILIIILERVKMIGTLKTLGMSNRSIQIIFMMRTIKIILSGLRIGNIIGVGICFIQLFTGIIKLDAGGYFLSTVPIHLSPLWLLPLNVGLFCIIVLVLMLPTMIISIISPEKSIRYE
ncbi:MAG: ABC transporter permease [Rikenellaceae bacterium]